MHFANRFCQNHPLYYIYAFFRRILAQDGQIEEFCNFRRVKLHFEAFSHQKSGIFRKNSRFWRLFLIMHLFLHLFTPFSVKSTFFTPCIIIFCSIPFREYLQNTFCIFLVGVNKFKLGEKRKNAERRAQSAERRVKSAERRVRSAECGAQSAERRAQCAE